MSQLRHRFATTLATLSLSAAVALASANAVAQQPEHAHSADHSAGYSQQIAASNPAAQRKAAIDSTESFISAHKQWAQSRGASNKAAALENLIAKAEARRDMLAELIKTNPAEALRVAIPEEKQAGMPAEVLTFVEQQLELEGELEIIYVDNFEDVSKSRVEHAIKTPFGERFTLHFAKKNENLQTGQKVRLNGLLLENPEAEDDSDGTIAIGSNDENILTLGAENGPTYGSEPGVLANTFGEQRTLVMMVNFQDDSGNKPWSKSDIQSTFNAVDDYYQEVSYGQAWLSTTVAGWYTLPVSGSTCNRSEFTNQADQAAANAGINVNDYDRLVYVWPRLSSCGWGGLGTVGGAPSRSWSNGKNVFSTFTHEMGHNMGLYHAHDLDCGSATLGSNCSVTEYGDTADMMGAGRGHFNVYEKSRLGWIQPQTITSSGTFNLAPHELDSNQPLALKVLKGFNSTHGANDWYYLEYRQAIGADIGLSYSTAHNLTSGVTVHTGNEKSGNTSYLLDMNPSGDFAYAAIDVGQTYNDKDAGISFTTQWTDNSGAEVSINIDGNQNSCVRANPSLSLSPGQSPWVQAGTTVNYSVTLTNRDSSACSNTSFNLNAAKPSGWSADLGSSALSLAPGQSATTTLTATSASTATDGFYTITANAASGGYSANGTVTYVVDNPVSNSAPVAISDSATTDSGAAVTIPVLSNDSDPDGDNLTITSVSGVNGTAKINNNGTVTFTSANGFSGTEMFSYSISDGNGGSANANVSVTVNATAGNSAPVAGNDTATTDEGVAVTIPVLNNDSDPDGDSLTVTSVSGVNGTAVINNGTITFTPANGFSGTETFSYVVSDGNSGTDSATVSVTVNAKTETNNAPIAVNDSATMPTVTAINVTVLVNDSDPEGDSLKVQSVTQGAKGSVKINADGTVTYTPGKRFKNADSFSYTITDGAKTSSATVSVQLQKSTGGSNGKGNGKKN